MVVAKLNTGYPRADTRRKAGKRARCFRYVLASFLAVALISLGLSLGYISKLSMNKTFQGAGYGIGRRDEL